MKVKTLYFPLFFILSIFIVQQLPAQSSKRNAIIDDIVKSYTDSLNFYKKKCDSLRIINDSVMQSMGYPADNKYFRLFSPLAYYPDIANRALRMDKSQDFDNAADRNLLQVYLNRPDLVEYSSTDIPAGTSTEEVGIAHQPERIELTKQVKSATPSVKTDVESSNVDLVVTRPNFWTFHGDYYLQFLQNYVSENWYKSGANSYSMMGTATLQYNYNNKQKVKWDNKLELRLGFQTTEADTINKFKTSDDLVRYTSKLGLQAHANWYYTMQLIAQTQFTKGLRNNNDYVFSDFMSPFTLNVSLGMDYTVNTKNKKLTGAIHIAPFAFKFKYVDRKYLAESFGIYGGHRTLEDFGSQYTIDITWAPVNNFKWKTRIYGYTTYHKYEMEWENTLTLQFNKYISTCLYLYPRFDDSVNRVDDHGYIQFKEYFSFGFSYSM